MATKDQQQPPFCNYHVGDEQAGLALIAALRKFLPGQSWSEVRRLIHHRHVVVNGNLAVEEGQKLRAGDVVQVWQEPRNPPPRDEDIKIRYLDRHLVVVEKPAGVTTLRQSEEKSWPRRRRQIQPTLGRDAAAHPRPQGPRKPAAARGKPLTGCGCGPSTAWTVRPAA